MSGIKYQIRNSTLPTLAPVTAAVGLALSANGLQAATITVDSLGDGALDPTICTLRAAVYSVGLALPVGGCIAGNGIDDTIVFASELSGQIRLSMDHALYNGGSTILITRSVSIEGPGPEMLAVVGAGSFGSGPVLFATTEESVISISGLSIRNGFAYGVAANTGGGPGGGILCHARKLTLDNVWVRDNRSAYGGGGVWHEIQTDYNYPQLTIRNSEFSGNTTYLGSGGAVGFDHPPGGRIDVRTSIFTGNIAYSGSGGALAAFMPGFSYDAYLINNQFNGNLAHNAAGAVQLEISGVLGYTSVSGNTFSNNTALDGVGGGLLLEEGDGTTYGRRVFFLNNDFQTNTSSADGGGAYLKLDGGFGDFPKAEIHGNQFTNNQSGGSGGGLKIDTGEQGNVTFIDNSLTNNHADSNGGGLHLKTESADINVSGLNATGNLSYAFGGGIFANLNNSHLDAERLTIAANTAYGYGGGAAFQLPAGSTVDLNHATISANQALGGGGIFVTGQHEQFMISDSAIFNNHAYSYGGGLDHGGGSPDGMTLSIIRTEISHNQSGFDGGGIWAAMTANSFLNVINSTISGNSAGMRGGGIRTPTTSGVNNNFKYSTIAFNHSGDTGGGIFSNNSSCSAINTIISDNQANTGPDLGGPGPCSLQSTLISNTSNANIVNNGDNLTGVSATLGSLDFNGGPTRTHSIDLNSPAFNAGNVLFPLFPPHDQRGEGFDRVRLGALDIGAYELQILPDFLFRDRFEGP